MTANSLDYSTTCHFIAPSGVRKDSQTKRMNNHAGTNCSLNQTPQGPAYISAARWKLLFQAQPWQLLLPKMQSSELSATTVQLQHGLVQIRRARQLPVFELFGCIEVWVAQPSHSATNGLCPVNLSNPFLNTFTLLVHRALWSSNRALTQYCAEYFLVCCEDINSCSQIPLQKTKFHYRKTCQGFWSTCNALWSPGF